MSATDGRPILRLKITKLEDQNILDQRVIQASPTDLWKLLINANIYAWKP